MPFEKQKYFHKNIGTKDRVNIKILRIFLLNSLRYILISDVVVNSTNNKTEPSFLINVSIVKKIIAIRYERILSFNIFFYLMTKIYIINKLDPK